MQRPEHHKALAGPSITELFTQAKKLLALQPRVENRHLRKSSLRAQLDLQNANKLLSLLLPLSMEDQAMSDNKATPPTVGPHKLISHKHQNVPSQLQTPILDKVDPAHSTGAAQSTITPSSIDGLLPRDDWANKAVKNEPTEGISAVDVHFQTSPPACRLSLASTLELQRRRLSGGEAGVKSAKSEPPAATAAAPALAAAPKITECSNCHTKTTPLWRKDPLGNTLCNACGLFLKLHGTTRPLSLKTDVIKKRSSKRASAVPPSKPPLSVAAAGGAEQWMSNGADSAAALLPIPYSNASPVAYSRASSVLSTPSAYGSLSYGGGAVDSRPKNVLILPKPPVLAASSLVLTPVSAHGSFLQRMVPTLAHGGPLMPLSPYSTSASSQFKRKKSEVNMERLPQNFAMTAGSAPIKRGGFSSVSVNRRTSSTNLFRKTSYGGGHPHNTANGAETPYGSGTFMQNLGFQNSPAGVSASTQNPGPNANGTSFQNGAAGFASGVSFQSGGFSNGASFSGSFSRQPGSFTTPAAFLATHNSLPRHDSFSAGSDFGVAQAVDTPLSVPLPLSFSSSGPLTSRPLFAVPSYQAAANSPVKGDDNDMDTDDFFKSFTSLHNDSDDDQLAPMDLVGARYKIVPTASTQLTLTHGLKGQKHHRVGGGGGRGGDLGSSQSHGDLEWLKFEI